MRSGSGVECQIASESATTKNCFWCEIDKAILQTLAYIAHKQPIRQADVVRVRSNKAYSHISELVKHGFIEAKKDGVSKKLSTTRKFYDYFDLPKDEPFELEE